MGDEREACSAYPGHSHEVAVENGRGIHSTGPRGGQGRVSSKGTDCLKTCQCGWKTYISMRSSPWGN